MSSETLRVVFELGKLITLQFAYDNFDIFQKSMTPTIENNFDPLKHLTSALVFPFQHDVEEDDLRASEELWQSDSYNDKSEASAALTKADMWSKLPSRYSELVTLPGTEEADHHVGFRVWLFLRDLIKHGPEYFKKFSKDLSLPEPVGEPIPVKKTNIIPLQSMDISNSTVIGNIETIEKLLYQTGLAEYEPPVPTTNLDPYVLLFHGDLGTGDRINSARQRRSIETSPRNRLQFVIFVMGLFHTKMACAETIWRTFLKDSKARSGKTSVYSDFVTLRPRDSSALSSAFKFRPVHDAIRNIGTCRRLDCLRIVAEEQGYPTLQAFADSNPDWNRVKALVREAIQRFVPSLRYLASLPNKEPEQRDEELENSMGFNVYSTLYEEISHAMDHGDIGRVEMCLIAWVPLFEAAGKNKYSSHTIKLVYDLNHRFTQRLRYVDNENHFASLLTADTQPSYPHAHSHQPNR